MAFVYLPRINSSDYAAVRATLEGNLPDSHEVWLKLQVQEELDLKANGHIFRHIRINPDEFARYCVAHSHDHNSARLNNFVNKKVGGASY
jgi:hypothetical protein